MNTRGQKGSFPNVRVEFRAPGLIRVEEGLNGTFEDRPSLMTPGRRDWPADETWVLNCNQSIACDRFQITLWREEDDPALRYRIHDDSGTVLYECLKPLPSKAHLPAPSDGEKGWAIADRPRLIPPPWGACPPPDISLPRSGWHVADGVRDEYVFLRTGLSHRDVIREILRLTGPVPMIPLCVLGLADSRWHPYRQEELVAVWDRFDAEGIPLDIAAVDTDWRKGSSTGYEINTELFPDIRDFFAEARRRGLRTILNDHPEPVAADILDPAELQYRYQGLTSVLALGADYWWFDRNWPISLKEPAPGFSKEVWGMCLYHDICRRYRPQRRVLIMSNADGIHNGIPESQCSLVAHRYPIWWTGDTRCWWDYLEHGVRNAVNVGWQSLMPYLSEDLGGFWGTPDDELYARFVQYGALSPICRLHASYKQYRHPWLFGEAGEIAVDYIKLRYRLLPLFYTLAREAHVSGMPLLRRCDWEWPQHAEAQDPLQYLLGPDILVAPIVKPITPYEQVPLELLQTPEGQPGLRASFFPNRAFDGTPIAVEADAKLHHFWAKKSPHPGLTPLDYSIRWEGSLGPIPADGLYRLAIKGGMEVRLYVNQALVLDAFGSPEKVLKFADLRLRAGEKLSLTIEWRTRNEWYEKCDFQLLWSRAEPTDAVRSVWIPPGRWYDLWSGRRIAGATQLTVQAGIRRVPLWIRAGGLVPSIPLRMRSGEAYWNDLTLDAFVGEPGEVSVRRLYEDEGEGWGYAEGAYRETEFRMEMLPDRWRFQRNILHPAPDDPAQQIRLRVHGFSKQPRDVRLNGSPLAFRFGTSVERWPDPILLARGGGQPSPVLHLDLGNMQDAQAGLDLTVLL